METPLNIGGGSERASHNLTDQRTELTGSDKAAFERRARLHLGSEFQVIGDLRNWRQGWSSEVDPTMRPTIFTRVLGLNAHGWGQRHATRP